MTRRLVRALQRGGVTAEIRPEVWGVWRTKDRRRRMIGKLTGHEIELMKLDEYLKPSQGTCQRVWTWSEDGAPLEPSKTIVRAPRPLLHDVLSKSRSPQLRQAFSHAGKCFRRDIKLVNGDADRQTKQCAEAVSDAQTRLSRLRDMLSREDHTFLQALIMTDSSRLRLSKVYALRPDAIETKALSVLRVLTEVYLQVS